MQKNNRYVGMRYVPKVMGEWDKSQEYEPLMVVTYQGCSYTSKTFIPVNVDINNERFWCLTGNYNAQVENLRISINANVKELLNSFTTNTQDLKDTFDTLSKQLTKANEDAITQAKKEISDLTDKLSKDFDTIKTEHSEELENLTNEVNILKENCISVKQFGATGDGVTDDADSIIKAINFIADKYSDSKYMGNANTLIFPSGNYRITKQLKVPMYIHFKTTGMVQILSEVINDSAIWFCPDNDPSLGGFEDDWFRGKTISELIDGSVGGFFIKNHISTVTYQGNNIGDTQGAIGLEIGSRAETKPFKVQSFTTLRNVRIELFHIGFKLNSYHTYIDNFNKLMIAFCNIGIVHGSDNGGNDSGENISYNFTSIANCSVALSIENTGFGATFINSSLDYNTLVVLDNKQAFTDVQFDNCNIEGLVSKAYSTENNEYPIPLKDGYYGLYKKINNDLFYKSNLIITNTKLVLTKGTGNIIDCSTKNTLQVSFNNAMILTPMEMESKIFHDDYLFMCTDNVQVINKKVAYVDRRLGSFVSKNSCEIFKPNFEQVSSGSEFSVTNGMNVGDFAIWEITNAKQVLVENCTDTNINRNVMRVVRNTTDALKFKLQAKSPINVNVGDVFVMDILYKAKGTTNLNMECYVQDEKGNYLSTTDSYFKQVQSSTLEWNYVAERYYFVIGSGARNIMPAWVFNNTDGGDISVTGLHLYKIN